MTSSFFPVAPVCVAATTLIGLAAHAQTGVAQLATVEVQGQAEAEGLHAREAGGTKTELPLQELPQAVRVITRQAIDDLGARRLDDVLDYSSGVSRQNTVGGLTDAIAIRGLPGNEDTGMALLLNGFSANRGFNPPRDLAGVERIEFLKGPAAALYGSSEPGGTVNIVSKRPQWASHRSVEAYGGSFGYRRGAVDLGGPASQNLAWRLNVAAEQRDGFRDFVGSERQVVAPAFTWRLGRATALEYVGEYLRHSATFDRGVAAVDNRLGAVPRTRFLGEPGDGNSVISSHSHQLVLSHDWNADWRGRLALAQRGAATRGFSSDAASLRADGSLLRQRRQRDYDSVDTSLQAETTGRLRTGAIEHELLLGVESFRFRLDNRLWRFNPTAATPYAIDIGNPVYGQAPPTPLPNTDLREIQRNTAFYLQDTARLGAHWRLMGGLRFDQYEQSQLNRRSGTTVRQEPTSTSPRAGLSWLPTPQWTVYANAGRSFRPNAGVDVASRGFEPESGRSVELGGKWESEDKALGASAALFDIRKQNVVTTDPRNAGFSVAAGEVRSRGLEFDVAGQLGRHWRINGGLILNDVEITRDNNLEVGGRLLNAPRVQGSLLAVYQDAFANGQAYGIGGGVTHVGKRLGAARTQAEASAGTPAFELPDYTTAKLVGWWRVTPRVRLTLDVQNVFDKTFYTSSYNRLWVAPGTPRTVTVGLVAGF